MKNIVNTLSVNQPQPQVVDQPDRLETNCASMLNYFNM